VDSGLIGSPHPWKIGIEGTIVKNHDECGRADIHARRFADGRTGPAGPYRSDGRQCGYRTARRECRRIPAAGVFRHASPRSSTIERDLRSNHGFPIGQHSGRQCQFRSIRRLPDVDAPGLTVNRHRRNRLAGRRHKLLVRPGHSKHLRRVDEWTTGQQHRLSCVAGLYPGRHRLSGGTAAKRGKHPAFRNGRLINLPRAVDRAWRACWTANRPTDHR